MPPEVKTSDLKKVFISILGVSLVLILFSYAILSWQRYTTIGDVTAKAQQKFPGDRIESLIAYLNSDFTNLEEKTQVIWVLGELRDGKAILALQALSHAGHCDHSKYVCQRELLKALRKIKGETFNPYFWQSV